MMHADNLNVLFVEIHEKIFERVDACGVDVGRGCSAHLIRCEPIDVLYFQRV
jgi:hypothetical protein